MKEKLKEVLVNDEVRKLTPDDAEDVEILLEIAEDDYRRTRDCLLLGACIKYVVGKILDARLFCTFHRKFCFCSFAFKILRNKVRVNAQHTDVHSKDLICLI